jgi:photosystem II stability/assembly factor-like uncharacterized protein
MRIVKIIKKNLFLVGIISVLFSCKKEAPSQDEQPITTTPINWQKIAEKKPGTAGIKFLSMINDNVFYYGYYTTVYTTHDGGKSWGSSDFDAKHNINYILATAIDTAFACHSGGVNYTINGGATWLDINVDSTIVNATSIVFKNKIVGFISADNGAFMTTDGGLSWHKTFNGKYCGFSFTEDNVAYGIGADSLVIKSIDGGISWVTKPAYPGKSAAYATFIDKNTGFILRSDNNLFVTRDAALTYTQLFFGQGVTDIKFISKTEGFLITIDGTVHRTTDAGVTWTIDNSRQFIQYLAPGKNGTMYGSNVSVYKRIKV